jgi:hypothetical protein
VKRLFANKASAIGIISGAIYGIGARLVAEGTAESGIFVVMSAAFLFLVPIGLGVLTVNAVPNPSWAYRIFAPWIPALLVVLAAIAFGWEGSICVVMAIPALLVFASVGGILGATTAAQHRGVRPLAIALPFLVAPVEARVHIAPAIVETVTDLTIAASPDVIWPLVTSVDSIRESEQRPAFFIRLGFPRPVSATISGAGVGAVREARFERGLAFVETVTLWEERQRLGFTIRPNTESIPATTLDSHVTIGGPFFDVLTGLYELHPIGRDSTRLRLVSRYRLSTRFNLYAGWWASRVMRSIQENILDVHKTRAEARMRARRAT